MSLFRVRDFWSFELNELLDETKTVSSADNNENSEPKEDLDQNENKEAGFIITLGRFHSVGKHDIFVCAHLSGFFCLIQVPENKQPMGKSTSAENDPTQMRQLLLATQLGFPIVDLKCGYFTSTLKQSIALLSFDKLIVYQVKPNQVDLLTNTTADASDQSRTSATGLNESLFGHKLEEHHHIDLLKQELSSNLLVLSNQNIDHNTGHDPRDSVKEPKAVSSSSSSLRNRNKQLQLPQRDFVVVQYHNQFIITIIDHKRILGHFSLCTTPKVDDADDGDKNESGERETLLKLDLLSQFMGSMPMTYIKDSFKGLGLILSTSDNRIHCLQMSKLMALAKQSVMKRVALDLIKSSSASSSNVQAKQQPKSLLSYDNNGSSRAGNDQETTISVDLNSMVEWSIELAYAPIQMDSIQRSHNVIAASSSTKEMFNSTSQVFVMSRYYIDLFSGSSGQHLWSQRFENPLICNFTYTLQPTPTETNSNSPKSQAQVTRGGDKMATTRMLSLVCTDCLSADKCNLLILDEERIVWSALLNTRPLQLWRTNLCNVAGAIATLDSNKARLSLSYLGTNLDFQEDQLQSELNDAENCESDLDQLCNLDDHLSASNLTGDLEHGEGDKEFHHNKRRLEVDICLEASNQWPEVQVNSQIKLRPAANSSEVIQNIVATLEFDDLLEFSQSSNDNQTPTSISKGMAQVQLGSCWPDRREPISFSGQFRLVYSSDFTTINGKPNQQVLENQNLIMPKTLKVRMYLRYNILHSGTLLQEESFMLPLNMVARLAHIDYSSGLNQTLDDVLVNLNLYKRQPTLLTADDTLPSVAPYYLCDLFTTTSGDLMEIVDEIIESDLVCRGFNVESINSSLLKAKDRKERDLSTLENINLLAQSLDCRLNYNTLTHSNSSKVLRQSSEEYLPAIMISIALKVSNGASNLIEGLKNQDSDYSPYAIVWLHLCDLQPTNSNSTLGQEMVKLHMREWKTHEYYAMHTNSRLSTINNNETFNDVDLNNSNSIRPLLVSIECDYPVPLLFIQSHLFERLKRRNLKLQMNDDQLFEFNTLNETIYDSIDINYSSILKMENFIAISVNLYDILSLTIEKYDNNLRKEFSRLKEELDREYCRFSDSTIESLSFSKRLINLPDNMHQEFSTLSAQIKQYQMNLIRILSELEKLKKLDYQYSKISGTSDIMVERKQDKKSIRWPDFKQIID